MTYDKENFPSGLATPTQINITPTSRTVENTIDLISRLDQSMPTNINSNDQYFI